MSKIRHSSIKWVPFGNIVLFSQYGLSGATQKKGKYPVLRMGNLINGKISTRNLVYIDLPTDCFNKFKLKKNDLLVNRTNSSDLVGKTALFELDNNFVCASYLVRFVLDRTIVEPKFINYFFNTESSKSYLKALSTKGVSQSNINPTVLKKKFKIPLLFLSDQKKIVKILSTWDQAIEKLDKLISAKEKQFKWLLKTLISDKKNGPKWKIVEIDKLIQTITPNKKIKNQDFKPEGMYPIIDQSQSDIAGWTNDTEAVINVNEPVIIFGDHTCSIKYTDKPFAQGADGIKILKTHFNLLPKFLYFFLLGKPIRSDGYKRHFSKLKRYTIPLPCLEVQKKIVKILSKREQEVEILKQISKKYQEQKKGLMQQLLTGKYRVWKKN